MSVRTDGAVEEIFTFWQQLLSHARSRLDDKRRRLISARLKDGYTVEDLQLAIMGCRASDWHQGDNDRHTRYTAIELICRDAEHVDRFIEIGEVAASREMQRIAHRREEQQIQVSACPMPDDVRQKVDALKARYLPKAV